MMFERMRSLGQAKEKNHRREVCMKAAAEEAAQREEQTKWNALTQVAAEKEAAEARRRQVEVGAQFREQREWEVQLKIAKRIR